MDYATAFSHLHETIQGLISTHKTIEEIEAIRQFHEVVEERYVGSASSILEQIKKSFGENEKTIPLQPDWQVEMGVLPDTTPENNFLVVFWRVSKPGGGSLNLPYVIQRRSSDEFEVATPA